jgi:hypothetical protein
MAKQARKTVDIYDDVSWFEMDIVDVMAAMYRRGALGQRPVGCAVALELKPRRPPISRGPKHADPCSNGTKVIAPLLIHSKIVIRSSK